MRNFWTRFLLCSVPFKKTRTLLNIPHFESHLPVLSFVPVYLLHQGTERRLSIHHHVCVGTEGEIVRFIRCQVGYHHDIRICGEPRRHPVKFYFPRPRFHREERVSLGSKCCPSHSIDQYFDRPRTTCECIRRQHSRARGRVRALRVIRGRLVEARAPPRRRLAGVGGSRA